MVLLGASNLTRGLTTVIRLVRHGGPVEVLAALGHGRSYGIHSRVCGRGLPGILECGLWAALEKGGEGGEGGDGGPRVSGLITDIGNDIMYGVDPEQVARWVDECAARLAAHDARVAVTDLPVESVRTMSPRAYAVVRRILFPGRRIPYREALARVDALHDAVKAIATTRGLTWIPLDPAWYGLDPIHIRRRFWPHAWPALLSFPGTGTVLRHGNTGTGTVLKHGNTVPVPVLERVGLRTATAERWSLLGVPRGRSQPVRRLGDGTTLALY